MGSQYDKYMLRLLIRVLIFLASAALGLLIAAWLLPGVTITFEGFVVSIVVFALVQSILTPFFMKLAAARARAFLGGVGLVATFVALLVAHFIPGGLGIADWRTWVLATMVIWIVTALATWLLPILFLRKKVSRVRSRRGADVA